MRKSGSCELAAIIAAAILSLPFGYAIADELGPQRLRLTETSITETGRLSGIPNEALTTKGYGIGYISPWQVGAAYTCLHTYDRGGVSVSVNLTHCYLDGTYTAGLGDYVLLTGGAGYGVNGSGSLKTAGVSESAGSFRATSVFFGPGVALGAFEIYWIYGRNWASYEVDHRQIALQSKHYQLGLGWHF